MRGNGINYDTGFSPGGRLSRVDFDPATVRQEMQVIARDLGCTAVRVSGGDPARLSLAAQHAAAAGLEVWFAPFPCELAIAELAPLFAECADRAEWLRRGGAAAWAGPSSTGRPVRPSWTATIRDEDEQVRYLREVTGVFAEEGVDLAFWFTFAGYGLVHDPEPRRDLDLASYGVARMLPGGPPAGDQGLGWEPKLAFRALAGLG